MTDAPWLISRREVAELFRVSGKTLRRWEQAGLLVRSPESLPNHIYYLRAEVEVLLERGIERA